MAPANDEKLTFINLPDEIQIKIWEAAIPKHGVHFFKISLPEAWGDQPQKCVEIKAEGSPSTRHHIKNLLNACRISRDVVAASGRVKLLKAEEDEVTDKQEGTVRFQKLKRMDAMTAVDGKNDLVCFKVDGFHFDFDYVDQTRCRSSFKGVTKVGLVFGKTETKKARAVIGPFQCMCFQKPHLELTYCPIILSEFLLLFPDMTRFYFVLGVSGKKIRQPPSEAQPRGKKRKHDGQEVVKKSANQLIDETLKHFADTARKSRSMDVFEDNQKTYYQVKPKDYDKLTQGTEAREILLGTRKRLGWIEASGDKNAGACLKNVKLGLLAYRERQAPRQAVAAGSEDGEEN